MIKYAYASVDEKHKESHDAPPPSITLKPNEPQTTAIPLADLDEIISKARFKHIFEVILRVMCVGNQVWPTPVGCIVHLYSLSLTSGFKHLLRLCTVSRITTPHPML